MHRVMVVMVLIFVGCAVPASAQEISDEELFAYLKARSTLLNNREVIFRTRYYYSHAGLRFTYTPGSGAELPAIPEGRPVEPPDELEDSLLSTVAHHRVVFSNGKIRAERLAEVDPLNEGGRAVRTWDGFQARAKSYDPDGEGLALRITTEPDRGLFSERYWMWLGTKFFSNRDMTPAAIFQGAPEKQRRVEAGVTIWILDLLSVPGIAGEIEIRAVRDPDVRITSIARRSYYRDEDRSQTSVLRSEVQIEFDGNAPEDDLLLPRRARLTTKSYIRDGTPQVWGVETFELESIEPLGELPKDFFRISDEDQAGLLVADERYQIAYEVGGHDLNMDGRILRTDAPLGGEVGSNLADLVERGEYIDPPKHDSGISAPPAFLWWIAGGTGFLGIVLLIVTRKRT